MKNNIISTELTRIINKSEAEKWAREMKVIQRSRKIKIVQFIWALVFSSLGQEKRSISQLAQTYFELTKCKLSRSSIYNRLNWPLAKLLKKLCLSLITQDQINDFDGLSTFKDCLIMDSVQLRLHDQLKKKYPGNRKNHSPASMKIHYLYDLMNGAIKKVRETSGKTADVNLLKRLGPWIKDSLLLIDLGYFSYNLFDRIQHNQGYFISRLKTNSNPKVVAVNSCDQRDQKSRLKGKKLKEILPLLKGEFLDVEIEVRFKRQRYMGFRSSATQVFRLIAIYNHETSGYHCYMTNTSAKQLSHEQVPLIYALRWQVEICFKGLRQYHSLDQLPSQKEEVVQCLLWASILSNIVSGQFYKKVKSFVPKDRTIPRLRWMKHFAFKSDELLLIMAVPKTVTRYLEKRLLKSWLSFTPDPNINRKRSVTTQLSMLFS